MESDMITVEVRLHRVTKDEAQAALYEMEEIFYNHEVPDESRIAIWGHFQTLASDVLIRFGEFNPEIGYDERNGHT